MVEPEIVAAAIRLAPAVRAARDDAERMRQTPPSLAAAITEAGIYQMYLPRSMGGPETPPLVAFRVVEELSRVDGSVGWCAMIATALSLLTLGVCRPRSGANWRAHRPITAVPVRPAPAAVHGTWRAVTASKAAGISQAVSKTPAGSMQPAS